MNANFLLDAIGLIVAIVVGVGSIIALRHRFKMDEQTKQTESLKLLEKHTEWMKNIEFSIKNLEKETQQIIKDRVSIVEKIYSEITSMKKAHEHDVDVINKQIEKLIDNFADKHEKSHKELKTMLHNLDLKVERVCTQFEDHEKKHE